MRALSVCVPMVLLGSAVPALGSLLTVQTRQTTFAIICINGNPLCAGGTRSQVDSSGVDSVEHANNFDGNLLTPSEARTAARSGPLEIAANASIRHRNTSPFVNYTDVFGDSLFEWDVLVLNEGEVRFTFNLPPGFVEIESNAELQDLLSMFAAIQVDIQYCSPACTYSPANGSLFQMFSSLEGGYNTPQLMNGASSVNPGLDISPLTHRNVVLTDGGFIHTWTWEFGAFTGEIPLGHFVAGQTFSLSYRLIGEARTRTGAFETWAAAAINDPFFLSTDALPQQSIGSFVFVPAVSEVPEPRTGGLTAVGLGLMTVLGLRSRARGGRG